MCLQMHNYFTSDSYNLKCRKAFNVQHLDKLQNRICTEMYFSLLKLVVQLEKQQVDTFKDSNTDEFPPSHHSSLL